jgi:hypothetical protein
MKKKGIRQMKLSDVKCIVAAVVTTTIILMALGVLTLGCKTVDGKLVFDADQFKQIVDTAKDLYEQYKGSDGESDSSKKLLAKLKEKLDTAEFEANKLPDSDPTKAGRLASIAEMRKQLEASVTAKSVAAKK